MKRGDASGNRHSVTGKVALRMRKQAHQAWCKAEGSRSKKARVSTSKWKNGASAWRHQSKSRDVSSDNDNIAAK